MGVVESEGRIVERKVSLSEARTSDAVLRTGAQVVSKSAVLRSAADAAGRGAPSQAIGDMTLYRLYRCGLRGWLKSKVRWSSFWTFKHEKQRKSW